MGHKCAGQKGPKGERWKCTETVYVRVGIFAASNRAAAPCCIRQRGMKGRSVFTVVINVGRNRCIVASSYAVYSTLFGNSETIVNIQWPLYDFLTNTACRLVYSFRHLWKSILCIYHTVFTSILVYFALGGGNFLLFCESIRNRVMLCWKNFSLSKRSQAECYYLFFIQDINLLCLHCWKWRRFWWMYLAVVEYYENENEKRE